MTSQADIRRWLKKGKEQGATHMLVVCDTFDYDDYPVYIHPGQSAKQKSTNLGSMQRLMECYSLSMDIEAQLKERRSHNY